MLGGGRQRQQKEAIVRVLVLTAGVLLPTAIAWMQPIQQHSMICRRRVVTDHQWPIYVVSNPQSSAAELFRFELDDDEGDSFAPLENENPFVDLVDLETAGKEDVYAEKESASTATTMIHDTKDPDDVSFIAQDETDSHYQLLDERETRFYSHRPTREQCLLVGVEDTYANRKQPHRFSLAESLTEMKELARTAGIDVVDTLTQRLPQIHPRTYMGTGKVKEVQTRLQELGKECCTVLVDAELSPGQQKALEKAFNQEWLLQNDFNAGNTAKGEEQETIKILDRTALILDIFAQHAKTREGKLQVDLALHEYRKPRLTKLWTHLERQSGSGGVGLRGMGESQLEIDKRLIRDRIHALQRKITAVQQQRSLHRRQRQQRLGLPVIALVGYTNAGKSSLLNALTTANVLAESMLFATLDPTTRKLKLPGLQTEVLLTDTVGFIQKLPTHLVAAFRATLEEVQHADVLVHVLDVSNPTWPKQEQAVDQVLGELGVPSTTPVVRVWNKMDVVREAADASTNDGETNRRLQELLEASESPTSDSNAVAISATQGYGLDNFVVALERALADLLVDITVILPYDGNAQQYVTQLHEQGHVHVMDYRPDGTYIQALAPGPLAQRLQEFRVKE